MNFWTIVNIWGKSSILRVSSSKRRIYWWYEVTLPNFDAFHFLDHYIVHIWNNNKWRKWYTFSTVVQPWWGLFYVLQTEIIMKRRTAGSKYEKSEFFFRGSNILRCLLCLNLRKLSRYLRKLLVLLSQIGFLFSHRDR